MLDAGERLEPDRGAVLQSLRAAPAETWAAQSGPLKENSDPDVGGLPKKLMAGSDFPFRWMDKEGEVEQRAVDTLSSHARGGLSNIWGANLLPLLAQDVGDWDLPQTAIEPYYKRVSSYVPLAAARDELESLFPIHAERFSALPVSRQAAFFLKRLRAAQERLHSKGVYFGGSRLAVQADPGRGAPGCVACGLCLYGCPYDLIYCSAWTVVDMQQHPSFQYRPGVLAERVESKNGRAVVSLRGIADGAKESIEADRVFIGAGAVNSTRLLLASLGAYGQSIEIKDSQYLLIPLMKLLPTFGVTSERLHTLSQVCLGFLKSRSTNRSIHGLIYTYNDLYLRAVMKLSGILAPIAKPLVHELMGHLSVYQGYLHSDDSHGLVTTLERRGEKEHLVIEKRTNPRTQQVLSEVRRKLLGLASTLGAAP